MNDAVDGWVYTVLVKHWEKNLAIVNSSNTNATGLEL
jgi:hypothetical protein